MLDLALLALLAFQSASTRDVTIISSKDGSPQHALFKPADKQQGRSPLLVVLHSWSTDYNTTGGWETIVTESQQRGWAVIAPNFRGPNDKPDACASDLAIQDVLDSIAFARAHANIDEKRIFLLGSSGGGFMALVMAARAPRVWAGVSAWVPITNLITWHDFSKATGSQYHRMMDKCFGGPPDTSQRRQEYKRRSPIFSLSRAKGVRIYIDAGIRDGHDGNSVPVRHSLEAFNQLAKANGAVSELVSEADIDYMTSQAKVPPHLATGATKDTARREKVLFRRTAGPVTVTIFDGGHSIDIPAGVRYFE